MSVRVTLERPVGVGYTVVFEPGFDGRSPEALDLAANLGGVPTYVFRRLLNGYNVVLPDEGAAATLRRNPNVRYVAPDVPMHLTDTQIPASIGLDRVDQRSRPTDDEYSYFYDGSGIWIYIVDSGIDRMHPDFSGRVATNVWFTSQGDPFYDCTGHGTAVASVAGGTTLGVAKDVTLVSLRTADCNNGSSSGDNAAAVDFAADAIISGFGPGVINLSLGHKIEWWEFLFPLEEAIRNAVADGVPVIVSAGNDGENACDYTPARVDQAITVAATEDTSDKRVVRPGWWSSNYGSCVDLFAPGLFVDAADPGGGVSTHSGTSIAAPLVTGTAALVINSTGIGAPSFVWNRIGKSATVGVVAEQGSGSPNLLLYALHTSVLIQGPDVIDQSGSYQWSVNTYGGDGSFHSFQWLERVNGGPWNYLVGETGPTYTRQVGVGHDSFDLRVVTTSFGDVVQDQVAVQVLVCDPEDPEQECNA